MDAGELQQASMPMLKSGSWAAPEQFLPERKSWEPMIGAQSKELKIRMMTLRTQRTRLKTNSLQLKNITKFG